MRLARAFLVLLVGAICAMTWATPEFVEHIPGNVVYGESNTSRMPLSPREDEAVTIYARIGYSFYYDRVALYYTTDGSTPVGSKGTGSGSTQVIPIAGWTFLRNESTSGGQVDWWKTTLPSNLRAYGTRVRYRIGAWHTSGGAEIFGNNYGCSDGQCDNVAATPTTQEYTVLIAWPGQGSAFAQDGIGYPPYHMWKEEAVVGNNFLNAMLDRNGTLYDLYYPSAGTIQGVAAKNEGYVGGNDTFPPGLPLGSRGQLNMNCAFGGLRVDGKTYWLTNSNGSDYTNWTQSYIQDTQSVRTTSRFVANGNNIFVEQIDFAPKGISYPTDQGGNPNPGVEVKRVILRNDGNTTKTVSYYYYMDPALNGGDAYDSMFADPGRGAMVAFDNASRNTSFSGEYNPSSFSDYTKSTSVYLAASIKVCPGVGQGGGDFSPENWSQSSSDTGLGWIAARITLAPGESKELNVALVGGFDRFAGATGTYTYQIRGVLDWFRSNNMSAIQSTTDAYWVNWLAQGTTINYPDASYNELFKRGLLATALHQDGTSGALVAGMHNGAYMYCWPRDAVWAAITLDRTGHINESEEIYRFLKDVAYRAPSPWGGKNFFYQKYTEDGYIIWSGPQVDETAVVPWGVKYHYDTTGDLGWMSGVYDRLVYDSARASSEDCTIDSRLYYDEGSKLMYSMSLWEDAYDEFVFSNANVVRGLWDAAWLAGKLGKGGDQSLFNGRATDIFDGMKARMTWNGENTDISQLGPVYPFRVLSPTDPLMNTAVDRMNGVATDRYGNNHPIMNFSGEFSGMLNRYWGDNYWNGGPWTLSTLWYGMYYLWRSDYTTGKGDIDNHKLRIDKAKQFNSALNLGAEQYAPSSSLLYAGQTDFRHQAAWPNAWESMSFYVDALIGFLDFVPDASTNTLRISPKIPTGWSQMTWNNVRFGSHQVDITAGENTQRVYQKFINRDGSACNVGTWLKLPTGYTVSNVRRNGTSLPKSAYTVDKILNRVNIVSSLYTGSNALTVLDVTLVPPGAPKGYDASKVPWR